MGVDDANRGSDGSESRWERADAEIATVIARELQVRDELVSLLEEIGEVPLEGPEADDFRERMVERAHELRPLIEGRMAYLRRMPHMATLVASVDLDVPEAEAEARQLALMVEGASACFAALAAQVDVFAELRRRGVPV